MSGNVREMRIDIAADMVRAQVNALLNEYPELRDDEELRSDSLEGQTDLYEVLAVIEDLEADGNAMCAALSEREAKLADRRKRFERKCLAMRALALRLMEIGNVRKVTLPTATLSIINGRLRPRVTDEDVLPDEYWRISRAPDLKAIGTAVADGIEVPGVTVANGAASLAIRRG
jgi:hypothetical protein